MTYLNQTNTFYIPRLQDPSTKKMAEYLYTSPEWLQLRCSIIEQGVAIDDSEASVCEFLGWDGCTYPECPTPSTTAEPTTSSPITTTKGPTTVTHLNILDE